MDPFSQSSNFLELLSSQQGTHIPMGSFSPSVGLESPQMIHFSPSVGLPSSPAPAVSPSIDKRRKWSLTEDVVLCSAWLNTSKDAVIGNEQRQNSFWKRVCVYFSAAPKLKGMEKREPTNCKQRWQKINDSVSKFAGAFEAATRHKSSGMNDDDVLKNAYAIYLQNHKSKFNLEHAWLELRYDQKWCSLISAEGGSKKRKVNEEEASSMFPETESVETRPEGVKAAKLKAKGKKKSTKADSAESDASSLLLYQNMWSVKEKDLALKKELGRQNLLDNLLSKKEPLTESENALKEKLISDILKEDL